MERVFGDDHARHLFDRGVRESPFLRRSRKRNLKTVANWSSYGQTFCVL